MRALTTFIAISTLALSGLALSACGDDGAEDPGGETGGTTGGQTTGDDAGGETTGDATTGGEDNGATGGGSEDATTTGDTTGDSTTGDDTTGDATTTGDGGTGDSTTGGETTGDATGGDTTGGETTGGDEDPNTPNTELLVKIIGPPLANNGKSHVAVQGGVTPLTGVAFGNPDSITWESSGGDSGEATGTPFWQTGGIPLEPGSNTITVTATKGSQTETDTIRITYNPGFLFDSPPVISPDILFVNEPTDAVVNVPITQYKSFNQSTVKVWLVDTEGQKTGSSPLSSLVDTGSLGQCDEIQEDGVFSACLKGLSCSTPEDIFISVSVEIEAESASYTAWSAPVRVECANRIPASSCAEAQGALSAARGEWTSAGGESGGKAARDAAIDWLKAQPSVANAGASSDGGYGVWVEFNDGFLGALNLSPAGLRGGAGPAVASMLGAQATSQAGPFNTKTINSKRAFVLAPYNGEFSGQGGDESSHIATQLGASGCPTFNVTGPETGGAVDLFSLRHQYLYGIIAMTTHGDAFFDTMDTGTKEAFGWDHTGSQEVLWTGEPAVCSTLTTSNKSCSYVLEQGQDVVDNSDCPTGTECVITGAQGSTLTGRCVDKTQMDLRRGRVILSDQNWGVTSQFVSRHARRQFPNSLVYLGSCRSIWNGTLAAEYIASGAKALAGYADYVSSEFANTTGKVFFDTMLLENEHTGAGWFAASGEDPDHPGGTFRLFGAKNLDIMNSDLINPSFETGDLTGWTKDGDGRIISKLGSSIPVHGKFMGIISTGLGFTVQTGEFYQNFCIPGDKNTIQFFWKYYSEEFKEWCGSQFQDTFEAKLANDVGQLTLVSVKVDDLCHYNDGSCASCPDPGVGNCECGNQYVGLIPSDISFDQGGVYNIQWQTLEKDISPLSGQGPVELKFFSTDQGDSIYDTVILLDSITFK